MENVQKSIEVEVPIGVVYNQWTQFEEFPKFMQGVEEVRQLSPTRIYWRAEIFGQKKEWEAEIYEQLPDQRISWRSTAGVPNTGSVQFEKVAENRTRVRLSLSYEPESALEKVGDALGILSFRVRGDLERFKEFIEKQGAETGAWRGQVEHGHVER